MMAILNRALLDFLWQGAVAALIALVVLHVTRKPGPRYFLLCSILVLLAATPMMVCLNSPNMQATDQSSTFEFYSVAALVWIAGAGIGLLHLAASWFLLKKRSSTLYDATIENLVSVWAERLKLSRPVQVVLDSRFEVPAIAGITRLFLYLPIALVTRLSPDQLEAIVVHELVHAKRYDAAINLCQTVIERIFFFHPAVWWISRQIRIEREHLCDEQVLRILPDRYIYASALAAVEELRNATTLEPAVAAGGGDLCERIARILRVQKRFRVVRHPIRLTTVACAVPILLSVLLSEDSREPFKPAYIQNAIAYMPKSLPVREAESTEVVATKQQAFSPVRKPAVTRRKAQQSKSRSAEQPTEQKGDFTGVVAIPKLPQSDIPTMQLPNDQASGEVVTQTPTTDSQTPQENYLQTLANARRSIENAKKSIENADRSLSRTAYGQSPNKEDKTTMDGKAKSI